MLENNVRETYNTPNKVNKLLFQPRLQFSVLRISLQPMFSWSCLYVHLVSRRCVYQWILQFLFHIIVCYSSGHVIFFVLVYIVVSIFFFLFQLQLFLSTSVICIEQSSVLVEYSAIYCPIYLSAAQVWMILNTTAFNSSSNLMCNSRSFSQSWFSS